MRNVKKMQKLHNLIVEVSDGSYRLIYLCCLSEFHSVTAASRFPTSRRGEEIPHVNSLILFV